MAAVMERTKSGAALWLGDSSPRPPLLVWRLLVRCEYAGMLVLRSVVREVCWLYFCFCHGDVMVANGGEGVGCGDPGNNCFVIVASPAT